MATAVKGFGSSESSSAPSVYSTSQQSTPPPTVSPSIDRDRDREDRGDLKPEVSETRAALQEATRTRNEELMIATVNSVMMYTTMGVDMSSLYPDMVKACNTSNIAVKKIIYMYLCEYARRNSDLALLTVNTLTKDCEDVSPVIRGLAIRSMGSFCLPNLIEYLLPAVVTALGDVHPYVRKNAVFAAAKLLPLASGVGPELVDRVISAVAGLVRDTEVSVALNAVSAVREIEELLKISGLFKRSVTKDVVAGLLPGMPSLSTWAQCQVIDLLCEVADTLTQDEAIQLMNALDDKLQDNNSAIVLAVSKFFLVVTRSNPGLHKEVYLRMREPLLLLVDTASYPEIVLPILAHLRLFLAKFPDLLAADYRHFFLKRTDPAYLKAAKIDLLTATVTEKTATDILEELAAAVTEKDPATARAALSAMGRISLKLPTFAKPAFDLLFDFLALESEIITDGVVLVFRDLLRKYPRIAPTVLPKMLDALNIAAAPAAKAAIVWAAGEYPTAADMAPYALEELIDNGWEKLPVQVRLELVTAAVKLVLARPPEGLPLAGKVLAAAVEDRSSADIRDRAVTYYTLLEKSPEATRAVVAVPKATITLFAEDVEPVGQEKLFDEINTLSVIYGKPIADRPKRTFVQQAPTTSTNESSASYDDAAEEEDEVAEENYAGENSAYDVRNDVMSSQQNPMGALVDDGSAADLLMGAPAPAPAKPAVTFMEHPTLDAATFQKMWGALPVGTKFESALPAGVTAEAFVARMKGNKKTLACIAAGVVRNIAKIYAFSQDAGTQEHFLVEMLITKTTGAVSATVKSKSTSQEAITFFAKFVDDKFIKQ